MKYRAHSIIIWIILVQLLISSSLLAQSDHCEGDADYHTEAQTAYAQEDFLTAVQNYTCALDIAPQNNDLRIERLAASLMAGDTMTAYEDVFLLNNVAPEAILARLDELRGMDNQYSERAFLAVFAVVPDYELALSDVTAILDDETNAFAYVIRAAAYEGLENMDEATSAFAMATELSPDDPQVYGLMAAAQFSIFNIPGIRENANQAIELDPNIAQMYRLRGFTSMVMGELDAVIEDANTAITLDPNYFAFYVLRGNVHLATGDLDAALADFDQIIELVPQASFGYALRAQAQLAAGDISAATSDMKTAIELDTLEPIEGESLTPGETMTLTMTFGRTIYLPFEAQTGDLVTISVTSILPGEVDPLILFASPDGTPLIFNDDADPENDVLDSLIADYEITMEGTHMLIISHARGGSEGEIEALVKRN